MLGAPLVGCPHTMTTLPAEDPAVRLMALRNQFVDVLLTGFAGISVIGLILIVSRALTIGWYLASTIQIVVCLFCFLLFLTRQYLPYALKVAGIFLAMGVVGVSGLPTLGLAANSVSWLPMACIIATVIFSRRVGLLAMGLTLLTLTVAATAFVTGKLVSPVDFQVHMRSPASWASMMLVIGGGATVVMLALGTYSRSVLKLLDEVKAQNEQILLQRDQITHLANHDPLTDLPTRPLASDRLNMACAQANRARGQAALLFIDLDGFKAVNDNLDHAAGDHVLKVVAKRLTGLVRGIDTVARQGGDEFLVVLNGVDSADAAAAQAMRIGAALSQPIHYGGHALKVGASIGVAVYPDHATDADALLKAADHAMYVAKRSGKNRHAMAVLLSNDGLEAA